MSKADPAEYIVVGKIGATYGVQGWLKVFSFTADTASILEFKPWYLEDGNSWQPIVINAGRQHGKNIIAQLPGYTNPEQARALTGRKIAIKRTQLPTLNKNEYYWSDLEGLTVINQHGETLGKVAYLLETGANDVLVVKINNKEHAIPYLLGSVVTTVDLANQVIHVNWDVI